MPDDGNNGFSGDQSNTQQGIPEPSNPGRTYTQVDLDNIIGKVKRGMLEKVQSQSVDLKTQAINEWREENGLSDEVLNSIANRDQHKLEINKREKALKKMQQEYEELQKRHGETQNALHSYVTKNAVIKYANDLQSNDPDTVFLWLKDSVMLDENGSVSMKDGGSVEDAVKKLLTDKPHLLKATITAGGGGTTGGSAGGPAKPDLKTPEGRKAALEKLGIVF